MLFGAGATGCPGIPDLGNRVGGEAKFCASAVARAIQAINAKPLTTFPRLLVFAVFTP